MGMYAYLQGLYVIGISLGLRWPELCLRCNTGSDTDVRRLPSNVLRWEARLSSGLGLGWDGVSKCEKRLRKEPKNLTAAFHQASLRPPMASLALQTPGGERLESGFCIHGSWPPASRKKKRGSPARRRAERPGRVRAQGEGDRLLLWLCGVGESISDIFSSHKP